MKIFANLSIRGKVLLVAAVAVIGSIMAVAVVLVPYRDIILGQKKIATKNVVETATEVIRHYASLSRSGKIDAEYAKRQALDELENMRYEGGYEYFWVNDMHPTMLMHPIKPELVGRDLSDFKDPNGKRLFVEFVDIVKQQRAGYVDYLWPRPGTDEPVLKLSYVQGFAPWGWIIGSGIYVDDVDAEVWSKVSKSSAMVFGMMLVVIAVGVYVTRWITLALRSAVEIADAVASGDLTKNIDVYSGDEVGKLLLALQTMNEKLQGIVTEVRVSSDSVRSAAKQIAAGNSDLSERTQSQACSLEETSSTMEEMAATVKTNADNARDADQLAGSARNYAEKGGDVVARAIMAMDEITTSSKKIVDIISVINDISFQTNLLSLNAAVEAARAGEQGRGFAVVASEIRVLARRSASAAKEIKDLIGDSVDKISVGSSLVDESGCALSEIVESVNKVSSIISDISVASQEQAVGIEEINKAVMQMDDVTQQNAALVEEAAAASKAMEEQAQHMVRRMSFFKTAMHAVGADSVQMEQDYEGEGRKADDARVAKIESCTNYSAAESITSRDDEEDQWTEF